MYFVYILKSLKDRRTYVGYTNNLDERLNRHNCGQVAATKNRRPLKLIYSEELESMTEAKKREKYWKNGGGRRKLKQMLTGSGEPLPVLLLMQVSLLTLFLWLWVMQTLKLHRAI